MEYEEFEKKVQRAGFTPQQMDTNFPIEEVAEINTVDGDTLYFRDFETDGEHVNKIDFDLEKFTIDPDYNHFKPEEMQVDDDELVFSGVTGTRPSEGRGISGFNNAELRFAKDGVTIQEKHS